MKFVILNRSGVTSHLSCVMFHVPCVTSCVSLATCHLSLTLTATAPDPPPAKSPIMHSRLVHKDPRTQKKSNCKEDIENTKPKNVQRCANIRDMLFDQKYPVQREAGFLRLQGNTQRPDIAIQRLNLLRGPIQ